MRSIQLFGFIGHRLRAKTRHGVHSPFVYRLVEECIYGAGPAAIGPVLEHFRRLEKSREPVCGTDFGKADEGVERETSVGVLARRAAMADYQVQLLARLAEYHASHRILELGTSLGKTASALALTRPEARIDSVEGNAAIAAVAQRNAVQLGAGNVYVHAQTFDQFLEQNTTPFDLVLIDGDHRYAPTLRYFDRAMQCLEGEGPVVLHDIYWSRGMQRAWREVCTRPEATVTIDLYSMGLVYSRPQQEKEHFRIRFPRSVGGFF